MVHETTIREWLTWLCDTYPTDDPPSLVVAPPDYDTIGDAEDAEEEMRFLFTSLAHEYRHHMQMMDGETFEEQASADRWMQEEYIEERPEYEKDAEQFADDAYGKWLDDE